MTNDIEQVLRSADRVVLVDWPSRDVPETLARAGYAVAVKEGPEPDAFSEYEMRDGAVLARPVGQPPDHADLVYSHRPLEELPGIIELARRLGARTLWLQSGLAESGERDPRGCWMSDATAGRARGIAESAGLAYVTEPYLADAVRDLGIRK